MKRLGDARIEALSLAAVKALKAQAALVVNDEGKTVRTVADILRREFQPDPELDRQVRARIASLKRGVVEGSTEWDVLYRQYTEELGRRR